MAAVDVPKQYKAAVYDRPGILSTRVETLDMPDPGAGEVLIHLYESSPSAVKGSPPMFFFWSKLGITRDRYSIV